MKHLNDLSEEFEADKLRLSKGDMTLEHFEALRLAREFELKKIQLQLNYYRARGEAPPRQMAIEFIPDIPANMHFYATETEAREAVHGRIAPKVKK